jgi:hypothetical protein
MEAYPGASIVDKELAKKTAITLENLILKYGENEGAERWNSYKNKQAYSNSLEYKQKKFGWSEDQFNDYNSSRAITIKNMIKRYGEEEGIKRWESYCERQAYTNTKQYFVETYGNDAGLEKFKEVNKKKAMPHDPVYLAEKLSISIDDAVDIILSRQTNFFKSNLEIKFVELLESKLGKLEYTNKTKPFGKWSKLLNTYVVFDIKHKNCIIEFNGDYWHANPSIYNENAIIRGKTASYIWDRDNKKIQTAIDAGFRTYVVWENDFKQHPAETISKVIKWILNEQQ